MCNCENKPCSEGTINKKYPVLGKDLLWINGDFINKIKHSGHFTYIDENTSQIKQVYIKKVVYSNPATIVFWSDDTKTVSKCHGGDKYSPEAGLAICVNKKLCRTCKIVELFQNWIPNNTFDKNKPLEVTVKDVRNVERGKICALPASNDADVIENFLKN